MKTKISYYFLLMVLLGVSFTLGAQTWATKPVANFNTVALEHNYATNGWDANIYTKWTSNNPINSFTEANNFIDGLLKFKWSANASYLLQSNSSFAFPYTFESKIEYAGANWKAGIVLRANPSGTIDDIQDGVGTDPKFNREGISISPAKTGTTNFRVQFTNADKTANTQFNIPNPSGVTTSLGTIEYKIEDYDSQIYVYINNQPFAIIALAGLVNDIYTSATVYDAAGTQVVAAVSAPDIKVQRISKVAFATRNSEVKLYSYKISTGTIVPTSITTSSLENTLIHWNGSGIVCDMKNVSGVQNLQVYNLTGALVHTQKLSGGREHFIQSQLKPGVYTVKIYGAGNENVQKIIVQ